MSNHHTASSQISWSMLYKIMTAWTVIVFTSSLLHRLHHGDHADALHYGGAHVASIVFAVMARRALAVRERVVGSVFLCFSLVLAYEAAKGTMMIYTGLAFPVAFGMSFAEQAFFVGAEHVQQKERELSQRDERHGGAVLETGLTVGAAVLAATTPIAASETTPPAASLPAHVTTLAPLERPAAVSTTYRGHADAKAHAIALAKEKPKRTQAQIAVIVGVPRSTVGRWLRETKTRG